MAEIKCIDVSEWQGNVDFKKVKSSGIDYVILRAGFGRESSQVDSEFDKNYKNAKSAGLKVGVYWYSYAVDAVDAKNEANACLEVLKGKSFELPVFYDMEEAFQTEYGKATLTDMAEAFCKTVKSAGFEAGVYANLNWFTNFLNHSALKKKYFIWLAQYNTEAQLDCDIWQYTSSAEVSGISGSVDMNIIYNDNLIADVKADTAVRKELKIGDKGIDVLCLKYMLQIASLVSGENFGMTLGNDTFGKGTETQIKSVQKTLKINQSGVADKAFADKLYKMIESGLSANGDINADGKVNVKDVTALQRKIAGDKDV